MKVGLERAGVEQGLLDCKFASTTRLVLRRQINLSLGRHHTREWRRPPGRPATSGWTRYALITTSHLLIFGGAPSIEAILG